MGYFRGLKCLRENSTTYLKSTLEMGDKRVCRDSRFIFRIRRICCLRACETSWARGNYAFSFVMLWSGWTWACLSELQCRGWRVVSPELMLGVWLYAYALGVTSARQAERRLVEDLAFRYLAAGARVDNWALSAFRRRHGRALNDAFTQVLEWAQSDRHGEAGAGGD